MENFVSQDQWEAAKKAAIGKDPLMKKMRLCDLDLDGLVKNIPTIGVGNQQLMVSNQFISKLASYLKINKQLQGMFDKREDNDGKLKLIRAIQHYASQSEKGSPEVILLGSRDSKRIEDVTRAENFGRVTNEGLFDLAEQLVNRHKNLELESVHPSGGGLAINLVANNPQEFKHAAFDEEEVFNFGFTLRSTFTTTEMFDYNRRLICTNGMIARREGKKTIIHSLDSKSMGAIYDRIMQSKGANFVPSHFEEQLIRAATTNASLKEVEDAYNIMSTFVKEDDADIRDQFRAAMRDNWFQGIRMTYDRIAKAEGGDFITKLGPKDKAFVKTPMKVWEVINSMTNIASNDVGLSVKGAETVGRTRAGNLMRKKRLDLEGQDTIAKLMTL